MRRVLPDILAESATISHVQSTQNTERCDQLALHTVLNGSPSDTQARDMSDSMTRYTSERRFAEERGGADAAHQCSQC